MRPEPIPDLRLLLVVCGNIEKRLKELQRYLDSLDPDDPAAAEPGKIEELVRAAGAR